MKKLVTFTLATILYSIPGMALSENCEQSLILKAASAIVQSNQEILKNLNIKSSQVEQLPQSQLVGKVWVDTVLVDIPVNYQTGSYAYTVSFDIRSGNCSSAKTDGKIFKHGLSFSNDSGGQLGSD